MAQTTSGLWKALWQEKNTKREYGFEIDGRWYGTESEVEHSVTRALYDSFGIGNASTAQLKLTLLADNIPRGATVKRYVRLVNGETASEWLPSGVFFINRRTEEDGKWSIEAFDAMRKAEAVWEPEQSLEFPMAMPEAAAELARLIGCELDPRTCLNGDYSMDYPANDYSIRQELQFIAAAHGGNWIVTGEGKLLLAPLLSFPEETSYLITEYGSAITLGGVRILV